MQEAFLFPYHKSDHLSRVFGRIYEKIWKSLVNNQMQQIFNYIFDKTHNRSQHILCSNPLIMRVRAILYLSKKCPLALVCTLSANHAILMLFFGNFVPIGKTSATASIALACADWNVCRYICKVVVGVECPKQLWTVLMSTPAFTSREAFKWRMEWHDT